jgi:hypothetical protein
MAVLKKVMPMSAAIGVFHEQKDTCADGLLINLSMIKSKEPTYGSILQSPQQLSNVQALIRAEESALDQKKLKFSKEVDFGQLFAPLNQSVTMDTTSRGHLERDLNDLYDLVNDQSEESDNQGLTPVEQKQIGIKNMEASIRAKQGLTPVEQKKIRIQTIGASIRANKQLASEQQKLQRIAYFDRREKEYFEAWLLTKGLYAPIATIIDCETEWESDYTVTDAQNFFSDYVKSGKTGMHYIEDHGIQEQLEKSYLESRDQESLENEYRDNHIDRKLRALRDMKSWTDLGYSELRLFPKLKSCRRELNRRFMLKIDEKATAEDVVILKKELDLLSGFTVTPLNRHPSGANFLLKDTEDPLLPFQRPCGSEARWSSALETLEKFRDVWDLKSGYYYLRKEKNQILDYRGDWVYPYSYDTNKGVVSHPKEKGLSVCKPTQEKWISLQLDCMWTVHNFLDNAAVTEFQEGAHYRLRATRPNEPFYEVDDRFKCVHISKVSGHDEEWCAELDPVSNKPVFRVTQHDISSGELEFVKERGNWTPVSEEIKEIREALRLKKDANELIKQVHVGAH